MPKTHSATRDHAEAWSMAYADNRGQMDGVVRNVARYYVEDHEPCILLTIKDKETSSAVVSMTIDSK